MSQSDTDGPVESEESADEERSGSLLRQDLGLFAVSTAVLTLEVLQFKIFAYSLDPLHIYLAVGVCLLGLGASATLLSVLPRIGVGRVAPLAAFFAALGGLLLLPVHAVFARLAPAFIQPESSAEIVTLVALTVPYFCFGMTISLLLVSRAASIGRAYAVNLGGSALGCMIVFPILDLVGAERAIPVVALLALASALVLHFPAGRSWRIAAAGAAVLLFVAIPFAGSISPFPPDPTGQLAVIQRRVEKLREENPGAEIEIHHDYGPKWDRTARVDVYRLETSIPELQSNVGGPVETRFFVQDSSAGSFLLGVGDDLARGREFYEGTVYGAGFQFGSREKVLVIGLGGAGDVLTALHFGATQVDGVDINGSTIDIIEGEPYRDFLGDPYGKPGVKVHQLDGRTFLRKSEEKYDLIQMSGVDTKSILASGSLSVNENYIYTREAMSEMLARIEDDGVICFLRFTDADAHILSSLAIAGLKDNGIEDAARHLFVLRQGVMRSVMIKRTPFTDAEVERLHAWLDERGGTAPQVTIPTYDWIEFGFGFPLEVMYSPEPRLVADSPYFEALVAGRLDDYLELHERDLSAPTDDRPFFFFRDKLWQVIPEPHRAWIVLNRPSLIFKLLLKMVRNLALISAVLILVPLVILRGRGLRTQRAGRSIVYFTCLGMGFMLFEIGLMHRFVLLLGHQSYAITVVLLGLLVGASLGSAVSSRMPVDSPGPVKAALLVLAAVIVVAAFALGDVFAAAATTSFTARLGLALAILIGMGFLLGIPFPVALRSLERVSPRVVPWGIGINGFASVVGSTLAVPTAMVTGLSSLLFFAAGMYLLAMVTVPVGGGEPPSGDE